MPRKVLLSRCYIGFNYRKPYLLPIINFVIRMNKGFKWQLIFRHVLTLINLASKKSLEV